jgi:hypothetical protein
MPEIFYSKRFWAAVASLLFIVTEGFGLPIQVGQIEAVVMTVVAWILGDSLRSTPSALLSYDGGYETSVEEYVEE